MYYVVLLLVCGVAGGAGAWALLRSRNSNLPLSIAIGFIGAYMGVVGSASIVDLPGSMAQLFTGVISAVVGAFVLAALVGFALYAVRARAGTG